MNELLFFIEIVLTFGCVVAAKKIFGKAGLIAWIAIAMILANLTVVKTIDLFGIEATLGNIMFASTFLAGDMLNENYGRQAAHKGILVGLAGVLVFMVCTQISLLYTPSTYDISQEAMALLFTLNLRTSIASVAMCILANWLNVSLYAKIRELTNGKYLWLRNNVTTITCNCIENFLFVLLAFGGIYSMEQILAIALSTCAIEIFLAVCDTPFLYLSRGESKLLGHASKA